jgi:hypothetical protein
VLAAHEVERDLAVVVAWGGDSHHLGTNPSNGPDDFGVERPVDRDQERCVSGEPQELLAHEGYLFGVVVAFLLFVVVVVFIFFFIL